MSGATANARIKEWEPGRDRPLCFHWKAVDIDWIKSLDLPIPRNVKHAEARASILLEALIANRAFPCVDARRLRALGPFAVVGPPLQRL